VRKLLLVSCCLVALVACQVASAAGIDDVATALKQSPVYVASGTENTDSDTADELAGQLNKGDNIVIVMLPASRLDASGSIGDLVRKIESVTASNKIIGLSVGDEVVGFSRLLPAGTAADLMSRAKSVSTNTSETLSTYVRNVHDWQTNHPEEPASKPVEDSGGVPGWIFLVVALAIGACVLIGVIRVSNSNASTESIKFKKSPDVVKELLKKLLDARQEVRDQSLNNLLVQICTDCEAYFARASRQGKQDSADVEAFTRHLHSLNDVLVRYVDIQDNSRYFEDADELLQSGYEAIEGFAELVLNSIKRDGRRGLTNFNVDTKILSAQRYS
jgi:hypothetical protein